MLTLALGTAVSYLNVSASTSLLAADAKDAVSAWMAGWHGRNEDSDADKLSTCFEYASRFGVTPGVSWGTMPVNLQQKWNSLACDKLVATGVSGVVACGEAELCDGTGCVSHSGRQPLRDGTIFADEGSRFLFARQHCPACACRNVSWPVKHCNKTVVQVRYEVGNDESEGIEAGNAPRGVNAADNSAFQLGYGSRLMTALIAAAYAVSNGMGFQMSRITCPVEARGAHPFCFFKPASKCGTAVEEIESSAEWKKLVVAPGAVNQLYDSLCGPLQLDCADGSEQRSLRMWRSLARHVLMLQPEVATRLEEQWVRPHSWASAGAFAAMHVRRGDKAASRQAGDIDSCTYATTLASLLSSNPVAQTPGGITDVFIASDDLPAVLRELGGCPHLTRNWTLHSNAGLPSPGRALTEHNVYRLLAEVSLLVRAKAVVVTKTSNVGSLVQILREQPPDTLRVADPDAWFTTLPGVFTAARLS